MNRLSPLQIELVKTFSRPMSEQQVLEIRQLLADYFARQVDDAVDQLFDKNGWDETVIDQWLGEHMRTAYRTE